MKLEFWITVCLGGGDGGDITVNVDVTEEEYELLVQCSREEDEIDMYAGLENLCERIREAAADEVDSCNAEFGIEEDYSDADYAIQMPDCIWQAAHADEDEDEDEEDFE